MTYLSVLPSGVTLGLTLERYQQIMRIAPAAFYGFFKLNEVDSYDCAVPWKQNDREALALAIAQAEEIREYELGYYLSPKYAVEEQPYYNPIVLNRKHILSIGTQKTTVIDSGEPISLDAELGTALVAAPTPNMDPQEIHIYHPGTDIEIVPSKVEIQGCCVISIEIPRYRLGRLDLDMNHMTEIPRYDDDNNFITSIDVKRVYHDSSDGASILIASSCDPLSITTMTAYGKIVDYRRSIVHLYPATYSNGVWTIDRGCVDGTANASVSYRSGRISSVSTEINTARLAHTLMPSSYLMERGSICTRCWKEDILENEDNPVETPYGRKNGAVAVWMMDSRAKVGQGGKFPSMST